MAAAPLPAGPVADFCAELRRLVRACGVPQAKIAEALGRGASSVSELLGGRRRRAPDWDDVRLIVGLCAERQAGRPGPVAGPHPDEGWWRRRHAELQHAVERARTTPAVAHLAAPSAPSPTRVPASSPSLDAADCMDMGTDKAVYLLADGRPELMHAAEDLLTPLREDKQPPYFLDALLEGFPQRVRAAHGLARGALLWAARVVLAAALTRCTEKLSQMGALDFVRLLTRSALQPPGEQDDFLEFEEMLPLRPTGNHHMRQAHYEHCAQLIRHLAVSCSEFALTMAPIGTVVRDTADGPYGTALAGLEALLAQCTGRDTPFPTGGRGRLRDPIASLDSPGPRLPRLAQGYVNPSFRVARPEWQDGFDHGVASDKWWEEQPSYDTVEHFFAGYLIGLPAMLAPLLVLGHPGAGKSLLTKLLTARLPAGEFRPLRVELRHTPAEADVQTQLEHALQRATGRPVSWPDWSEAEPGVVPVVLLDGFDELLQAGARRLDSARQWGYLREVERFQEREAELGRPLIVIVTSRTVVADRAEIPRNSQVLRLEPFGDRQIERWLEIWNTVNADHLDRHGLRPLTLETVLPHRDLATQPLLLLMLALYDSVDNALHRLRDEDISRTQLYDRLLTQFVRRQVEKEGCLPPTEAAVAVERELHRLSVIALGMFHRGAQSISGEEADRDLRALDAPADAGSGVLFGRFFFVHEAQAVVTEQRLRSYEFMHATFGEHLTARLIDAALRRLRDQSPLDDGELYALLSFTPLTDRAQIVQNLRNMLAARPGESSRSELAAGLFELFRAVEWDGPEHRTDAGYAPVRQPRAYRDAVYEANLVVIAVLAVGEVSASQLLGSVVDLDIGWRRHAMGWQAQMSQESWDLLCSTLRVHHGERPWTYDATEEAADLLITTESRPLVPHELDRNRLALVSSKSNTEAVIRRVTFTGDGDTELLLHTCYPLLAQLPGAVAGIGPPDIRSPAQTLLALLIRDVEIPLTLPDLYVTCLNQLDTLTALEATVYLEALLRQLVHDAPAMPVGDLARVLPRLHEALNRTGTNTKAMSQLALRCIRDALDRGNDRLNEVLDPFRTFFVESEDPGTGGRFALHDVRHMSHSTHTWQWAGCPRGKAAARELDNLLAHLDLAHTGLASPEVLIDLLRLAAELDLRDWLSAHADDILGALPLEAFGLLRPSDLRPLRAALPNGAYEAEFREVEWTWRGPTPPAETPAPRSPTA
ncbi:XRE family transcriptional regulator [Streptomyces sp. NRRL S-646]|uniref:XRE family transcriptional regulator n=1 Tax=Streptomyces sp. NRRL S-646 TaxID=1463917 RepID=UPI000AF8389F|nr:XRE family transcriptional regulator [Streptomyces sp. NRRL S-646]